VALKAAVRAANPCITRRQRDRKSQSVGAAARRIRQLAFGAKPATPHHRVESQAGAVTLLGTSAASSGKATGNSGVLRGTAMAWLAPPAPLAYPRKAIVMTLATAVIGLLIGMTLFLYALQGSETGIIATLSATSPVIILPLLWLRTGQRPNGSSWVGAALAVAGLALIFMR